MNFGCARTMLWKRDSKSFQGHNLYFQNRGEMKKKVCPIVMGDCKAERSKEIPVASNAKKTR